MVDTVWVEGTKLMWFGLGVLAGWDTALLLVLWRMSRDRRREAQR